MLQLLPTVKTENLSFSVKISNSFQCSYKGIMHNLVLCIKIILTIWYNNNYGITHTSSFVNAN